jgi:hypothetical protein
MHHSLQKTERASRSSKWSELATLQPRATPDCQRVQWLPLHGQWLPLPENPPCAMATTAWTVATTARKSTSNSNRELLPNVNPHSDYHRLRTCTLAKRSVLAAVKHDAGKTCRELRGTPPGLLQPRASNCQRAQRLLSPFTEASLKDNNFIKDESLNNASLNRKDSNRQAIASCKAARL